MRKFVFAIAATVLAILAAAISVSAANSPAQIVNCSTATACYSPNPIRVTVGSSVSWMNGTSIAHTATSDTGAWNTGAIAPAGTSSAVTFNTAGTFAYHCTFHADMHGSVIVSVANPTPAATPAPVRGLASSGGGPALPIGSALLLVGVALLLAGRLRRNRLQRLHEPFDKTPDQ
jgi:plastocyanin